MCEARSLGLMNSRCGVQVGPSICVFKTHVDAFDRWDQDIADRLQALADKHCKHKHLLNLFPAKQSWRLRFLESEVFGFLVQLAHFVVFAEMPRIVLAREDVWKKQQRKWPVSKALQRLLHCADATCSVRLRNLSQRHPRLCKHTSKLGS